MDKYYSLIDTGLSTRELAKIAGINHMTVHLLYKRETKKLMAGTKAALDAVTDTLLHLVEVGKLPMKATSTATRAANVEKIMKYIEKQRAACTC